jgi:hypothetical protein
MNGSLNSPVLSHIVERMAWRSIVLCLSAGGRSHPEVVTSLSTERLVVVVRSSVGDHEYVGATPGRPRRDGARPTRPHDVGQSTARRSSPFLRNP